MRINFVSLTMAFLILTCLPLPSRADWRDTLIRVLGPPLVSRGMDYLIPRQPSSTHRRTVSRSPSGKARATGYIPPPPELDNVGLPDRQKLDKLETPPPQILVPPPPPEVPSAEVLESYPQEMNIASPRRFAEDGLSSLSTPKVAPDFRRRAQH